MVFTYVKDGSFTALSRWPDIRSASYVTTSSSTSMLFSLSSSCAAQLFLGWSFWWRVRVLVANGFHSLIFSHIKAIYVYDPLRFLEFVGRGAVRFVRIRKINAILVGYHCSHSIEGSSRPTLQTSAIILTLKRFAIGHSRAENCNCAQNCGTASCLT